MAPESGQCSRDEWLKAITSVESFKLSCVRGWAP